MASFFEEREKAFKNTRSYYGFKTDNAVAKPVEVSRGESNDTDSFESIRAQYGFGTSTNKSQTISNVKRTQNNTNSLGTSFEGRYKPSAPVTNNFINQVGALPTKFDTVSAQKQYDNNLQEIANLYAKAQKENANTNYNVSEFGRYGAEIDKLIAQNKEIEKNIQNKPNTISNEKKAELEDDILFLNNGVIFLSDVEKNLLKYSNSEAYARTNGKNSEAYNTLKILSDLDNSYLSEYAGFLLEQIDYNANKQNSNETISGNTREDFNDAVKQGLKKPFVSSETKTAIGAGLESLPRSLVQVGGAIADAFGAKTTESEDYKKTIGYFSSWQNENAKNKELSKNYYNMLANEGEISKAGAKARQFVDDAGKLAVEGTIQSAPYVVLGLLSGGTSTATTAALQASANATKIQQISQAATNLVKNPGYWLSFTQQFGNDYFEAKENGANDYQAAASSLLSAAVNAGLEMGFGIQANADDVLKSQSFKEFASEWIESMLEEGTEEITQGAFSNFVDKIIWDSDKKLASLNSEEDAVLNVPNMWEEFKGGFIGSFLLSGAQMINSLSNNKSKLRSLAETYAKEDFSNWLEEKGSKNAEAESNVLAKALTGKYITEKEASVIFNSKEAFSLLEEMTTAKFAVDSKNKNATVKGVQKVLNQISDYAIGIPLRNNTENNAQNTRALMPTEASESGLNVSNEINRNVSPAPTQSTTANIDNTAVAEVNQRLRPAEAQIMGTDGKTETVAVNLFKDVNKGEVYVSNGETKTLGQVAFDDDAQRDLYFAARQKDYDTETANAMLQGFSNTPKYVQAFDHFYRSGASGVTYDYGENALSNQINEIVARQAFALGRQNAMKQNGKGGTYFTRDYSSKVKLKANQKRQLAVIESYANKHKIRVSVVASYDGGKSNGVYDTKTDTIVIALDAKEGAYVAFASHELAHRLKVTDIEAYTEIRDKIETYLKNKKGYDLEGRIKEIQALYKRRLNQELSREEALEEIVGNSLIPALSDRAFVENLAEENKDLLKKIREWIDEFIKELERITNELAKSYSEVGAVKEDIALMKDIRDIIDESLSNGAKAIETDVASGFKSAVNEDVAKKERTLKDIKILQSLPKTSVLNFTAREIEIAQKWAHRFYEDLKTKSPFFRAWFGEWREHDEKTKVVATPISSTANINYDKRTVKNADTEWDITVDRDTMSESLSHSGQQKAYIERLLTDIDTVLERAVLLDTAVSPLTSKNKKGSAQFMHYLYAIVEYSGNPFLAKIAVEEYDINGKRLAYNVERIKMSTLSRMEYDRLKQNYKSKFESRPSSPSFASNVDGVSLADFVALVKKYDKKYSPKSVVRELLDENGDPIHFYHGSPNLFTEFDRSKAKEPSLFTQTLGYGNYFTPNREGAEKYAHKGQKKGYIYEGYLRVEKPYITQAKGRTLQNEIAQKVLKETNSFVSKEEQNDILKAHGYDAIIKLDENGNVETVVTFDAEQFKAEKNIGTFSAAEKNMYHSLNEPDLAEIEAEVESKTEEMKKIRKVADSSFESLLTIKGLNPTVKQQERLEVFLKTERYLAMYDKTIAELTAKRDKELDGKKAAEISESLNKNYKKRAETEQLYNQRLAEPEIQELIKKSVNMQLKQLIEEYGSIKPGFNPVREIEVPKRTSPNKKVRQTVRTILESGAITDDMIPDISQEVLNETFSYVPVSDDEARNYAEHYLNKYGYEAGMQAWESALRGDKRITKNDIAIAEYLLQQAANDGNIKDVLKLSAELSAEGTRAGQTAQAISLLKKLGTPEIQHLGQLYYIQKAVDNLNKDIEKQFAKKIAKGKVSTIKIDEALAEDLLSAETEAEYNLTVDKIIKNVADQMPSTWVDKWNAWRYLAMLGNPLTHIRNIAGNTFFLFDVETKNFLGALIEKGAIKKSNRTKSIVVDKAYRDFASADFTKVKDYIVSGSRYDEFGTSGNITAKIKQNQKIFKPKWLETARKTNSRWLENEDIWFLSYHYKRALSQYLQANHAAINGLTEGSVMLEKARAYAIEEAQKATYRDFSVAAQAINQFAKSHSAARFALNSILPFRSTPINILKRGIEYSPMGLATTLGRAWKQYQAGAFSSTDLIDGLSAGFVGMVAMAAGALLYNLGAVQPGYDDEEEQKFDELQGGQEYSLKIGDVTYTFDWAAPMSLPFFLGAQFAQVARDKKGLEGKEIFDVLSMVTEPMLELSMLKGLNSTIESVGYDGQNKAVPIITSMASSYLKQAVPTLFGQVARILDNKARSTYIDKNSALPDEVQRFYQQVIAKVPFVATTKNPYINAWGEEKEESILFRILENTISPGYFEIYNTNDVEKELEGLYKATNEKSVLPKTAQKYFNVNNERKDLTKKEYVTFATVRGQTAYEMLTDLFSLPEYDGFEDQQKVYVVEKAYEYANATAKMSVSDYDPNYATATKWIKKANDAYEKYGIPIEQYILYELYKHEAKDDTKPEQLKAIDKLNLTTRQKDGLYNMHPKNYSEENIDEAPWN